MAIPSGLSSQLGIAQETVYGTYVAPTRFLEFESESLTVDKRMLPSRSIGHMFLKSGRHRHYVAGGGGGVELPFMNKSMGLILKHALGTVVTAQVGATAEYTHTFTPATDGGFGDFLTVQKGLADTGGTVRPFNYVGSKIVAWELRQAMDANLMLAVTFDAKTVQTSSGLAVVSYPTELVPLSFIDAVLTIDAAELCVRNFTVGMQRAMDVNRRCLGNSKREPVPNGEFVVSGTLEREFEAMDQYDDWIAGTEAALTATWEYGEIGATGNPFALVLTIPALVYTGETPTANGSEITLQNLPFQAVDDGTDPIIELVYHTSDTTP